MKQIKKIKEIVMVIGLACVASLNAQPAWTVSPTQYQSTMSITTQLDMNGALSADSNDMLGAFYGNECRGVSRSNFTFDKQHYVMLTVYGNTSGENLSLKIYEAASGVVYDLKQHLTFVKDTIIGSIFDPVVLYTNLEMKKLIAYNFFTPNNDGKNDYFIVDDILTVSGMTFKVHTPQGLEVYRQRDYDNTWNGVDKEGKDLPKGVYYYLFTAEDGTTVYKGSITLLR
jgi:gliding motility-associated-like protein